MPDTDANQQTAHAAPEPAPVMETHVYPDGSSRRGCAPFPKLSPLQEQAEQNRKHAEAHGQFAAHGEPLEPAAPPAEPTGEDLAAVAAAIEPTGEAVPPAPAKKK